MRYVEIVQSDLQLEFPLARSQPAPGATAAVRLSLFTRSSLDAVIETFRTAQSALEMYRRTLSDGNADVPSIGCRTTSRRSSPKPAPSRNTRQTGRDWTKARDSARTKQGSNGQSHSLEDVFVTIVHGRHTVVHDRRRALPPDGDRRIVVKAVAALPVHAISRRWRRIGATCTQPASA